jgi:hypothetical protein
MQDLLFYNFVNILDQQNSNFILELRMKSFLTHIHAAQELDAMSHQEGLWIEIDLLEIRRCVRNLAAKMELLANFCYLNHSGN